MLHMLWKNIVTKTCISDMELNLEIVFILILYSFIKMFQNVN